jgi:CheY-like chemotaxis protein
LKILVADDEPEIRATIGEYLTLHGAEVLEAANGLEALLHVKHARPGGIVLDLRMPRLGGLDALKRIRAFDPTIVVVILTAETDEALHRQALALGARAVLPKPVALPELLAALNGAAPAQSPAAAAAVAPVAPPAASGGVPGAATHVLVIDDDDGVRATLTEFLALHGYRVSEATSAVAGVQMLAESAPDVILLDIDMPGLSGADALPTIRAIAPHAIVIMVSGTTDEEVAKRTLAHGAFDYLVKPVDFDHMVQTLETALAMRSLET